MLKRKGNKNCVTFFAHVEKEEKLKEEDKKKHPRRMNERTNDGSSMHNASTRGHFHQKIYAVFFSQMLECVY